MSQLPKHTPRAPMAILLLRALCARHRSEGEHRTAEQKFWKWQIAITSLTAIVSFFAIIFAGLAWKSSLRQNDIQEAANRAYVSLDWNNPQIIKKKYLNGILIGLSLEPFVINTGNTPALHWTPWDQEFTIPAKDAADWKPPDIDPRKMGLVDGAPLGSKQAEGLQELYFSVPELEKSLSVGSQTVFCVWVFYQDTYHPESKRHYRACSFLRFVGGTTEDDADMFISRYGNFEDGD